MKRICKSRALALSTCLLGLGTIAEASDPKQASDPLEGKGFEWKPAIEQSAMFLMLQHSFRLATEPGTRADLKGPFFRDYFTSVRGVSGWRDGDPFIVNYVGHPMMGAVSGNIQVQNDPRGRTQTFGMNAEYWKSRMKALGWSAIYALQFEIGPLSEASLGNVGKEGRAAGTVDLVVTPVAGLAWQISEDALDQHVVEPLENSIENKVVHMLTRSFLNPSRSFSNLLRGKVPWHRDTRRPIWKDPNRPRGQWVTGESE